MPFAFPGQAIVGREGRRVIRAAWGYAPATGGGGGGAMEWQRAADGSITVMSIEPTWSLVATRLADGGLRITEDAA